MTLREREREKEKRKLKCCDFSLERQQDGSSPDSECEKREE